MQSVRPLWLSAASSVSPLRLVNVTDFCRQHVMQSVPLWISAAASVSPPRVSHQPRGRRHRFLQTAHHAICATADFCSSICLTSLCLASTSWKTMPQIPADSRSCSLCHCGFPQHHSVSPPRVSHQPRGRQCHRFLSADSRSCSLCHCGFPQQHQPVLHLLHRKTRASVGFCVLLL